MTRHASEPSVDARRSSAPRRVFYLLTTALLLSGCASEQINREYTLMARTIIWREVDTMAELNAACKRKATDAPILGCEYLKAEACEYYSLRNPSLESAGHAVYHCFTGRWHL